MFDSFTLIEVVGDVFRRLEGEESIVVDRMCTDESARSSYYLSRYHKSLHQIIINEWKISECVA